ncbi:DinB family protein [Knoellia koreensis]|uniref:DinB family protein n=1 Tax=Knoellia koreensis TaxID=2730921 RepID=A0A849HJ44_9MICO|nr:DinB family protein [Knoellia sp. DB2414S]NNM47448.1 DinB family protein [Knoellia sp. DB2414S]
MAGREFRDEQLPETRFEHVDLTGSRFDRVDLTRSSFSMVDLADVDIRDTAFSRVRMRGVELMDVDISGELLRVTVNGIDIGPLVEAELDRRHPERAKLRPADPAGYREAWAVLTGLWDGTLERARALEARDPALLHESVDGEWSFTETLRHLAFATSSWLGRAIQGNPSPWDPLELPWDTMPDTPGVPRDRAARPTLDQALELRHRRQGEVAAYLEGLTQAELDSATTPVDAPGWPRPNAYPVKECLDILLNEEWWHRQYAERDLAALESRPRGDGSGS